MTVAYDKTNPTSIESYAKMLVSKCLGQLVDSTEYPANTIMGLSNKGGYGQALEQLYFKINPGNDKSPDFKEAGVELKTSPLKITSQGKVSKERLVLNIIDYCEMADETWDDSTFLRKNALILMVFYLHQYDVSFMEYVVDLVSLWKSPPADLKVIKEDWLTIQKKILDGKAHEISEGDTNYLAACTKGATSATVRKQPRSEVPAKQRALSFKQKYINYIYNELSRKRDEELKSESILSSIEPTSINKTFEEIVIERFSEYSELTLETISKRLHVEISPTSKNYYDWVTRAMLGVKTKHIEEFEKADIQLKTIRIKSNGTPKEDISFRAF